MSGDEQRDRAAGALVGLAAGDALGAGYEFSAAPEVGRAEMIGGGVGAFERGEWTDDTQMAVCIAVVAAAGGLDVDAVGDRFIEWLASNPADVGIQTAAVLGQASSGSELAEHAAAYFAANRQGAAGNGSLMRTAPVALACLGDDDKLFELAHQISALTHGDPLAGEACALWCVAIDRAVREARLDGIADGLDLLTEERRTVWQVHLDEADAHPPSAFAPNGFVVTALKAAHASIHQTPVPDRYPHGHLVRGLQTAVAIGDDTDTVAAIAGSLLGARWGADALPQGWRDLLHGWPGYRAGDLVHLAEAITPTTGQ
jgi:ADP-ribosylglycohydrolase